MRPPEGQMPGTPSPDPISTRRRRIALRVRGLTAAQRIHGTRSRVPELGTPGSVGGRGGKPPRPTRPRWFRLGLSVAGPFGCRCLNSLALLRFHSPLIEPGGRFSRTGLSDKNSYFRPRKALRPGAQAKQSQLVVQVLIGEP